MTTKNPRNFSFKKGISNMRLWEIINLFFYNKQRKKGWWEKLKIKKFKWKKKSKMELTW
jgi:hypothetical protein